MRSTEEQLDEIMIRSERIKKMRSIKRRALTEGAAGVFCLALIVFICIQLPQIPHVPQEAGMHRYGSLLMESGYSGYILVSLLSFILGVCVTLLLVHLRELRMKKK